MLALMFAMVVTQQTPPPTDDFSAPPLVEAPAPDPSTPPGSLVPPPPPTISYGRRSARLVDDFDQPSTTEQLIGRAVMAPVLGAVGAGAAGFVGLLIGAVLGSGSTTGIIVFGIIGAGILGTAGLALGVALGASLFSVDLKRLFGKSIGWAFLASGIAVVLGIIFASVTALASFAGWLFVGSTVVLSAAVPFVVEWRRLADMPRAPEPTVTLATF